MSGPPGDFEAFCRAEWPRLRGALSLLVADDGVAEELTQETMIRVSARWEKVRSLESPGGWAHRVAVNLARSSWRRRQAARRAHTRVMADDRPSIAAPYEAPVLDFDLHHALAALPRREREAVVLRFATDLSVPQVAAVLRCPEGTVKSLTRRGLQRLRVELGSSLDAGLTDQTHDETEEGCDAS